MARAPWKHPLDLAAVLLLGAALAAAVPNVEETESYEVAPSGSRQLLAAPRCRTGFVYSSKFRTCICKPGYEYFPRSSTPCRPCLAGYYKGSAGNSKCKACPSGWYINKRGSSSCTRCRGGLVDPLRKRCQFPCKKHKLYGDGSVINWYKFWSVNTHTFYYKYWETPSRPSAAAVCDSLYTKGWPRWLIPAVITSKADAKKAAYLAEFHFKCERNPAGQTNYDWGYWFWILKSWDTSYPNTNQCNWLFHTKGAISDGTSSTLAGSQCRGPFPSGELLPVLCTQGCARFCQKCFYRKPGKCQTCVTGYRLDSQGKCTANPRPT